MRPYSLNLRGELMDFHRPAVMGIINLTDNSFHAPSRVASLSQVVDRAGHMLEAGASFIDLGACSTRPGSLPPEPALERDRLCAGVEAVRKAFGRDAIISVDTFRASVARDAVLAGADIINDIGGGTLDADMFSVVADLGVPYILMHMRGTPETMQSMTEYADVTAEVIADLSRKIRLLSDAGVSDVIVDPGFGFAKTMEQNYELLENLRQFELLEKPLLIGVSHKSMLRAVVGGEYKDTLCATACVNMLALERGAAILRVHDVPEAADTVKIFNMISTDCNV